MIPEGGVPVTVTLGAALDRGQTVQALVPANAWQGLALEPGGEFALLGTTVSPGFEYADFELVACETLTRRYPEHRDIIEKLTVK